MVLNAFKKGIAVATLCFASAATIMNKDIDTTPENQLNAVNAVIEMGQQATTNGRVDLTSVLKAANPDAVTRYKPPSYVTEKPEDADAKQYKYDYAKNENIGSLAPRFG